MNLIEYIRTNGNEEQLKDLEQLGEIPSCPVLVGVSGTIGKTTVVELIGQYLIYIGKRILMTSTAGVVVDNKKVELSYPCTAAPNKIELCKIFLMGLKSKVEYFVIETTAESTSVGVYDDLDFDCLTVNNIIKEIVRSFPSQDIYVKEKTKLFKSSKIKKFIYNIQCEKYLIEDFLDDAEHCKNLERIVNFNKHDIDYSVDSDGRLSFRIFGTVYSTNLLSSINLDNAINFLIVANELGVYDDNLIKTYLLSVNIPERLEHCNILGREVVFDTGYGGVQSVIPYFYESNYRETYIVMSTYCFNSDRDDLDIIKSFRQNKTSFFAQCGNLILTTGDSFDKKENSEKVLQQMKDSAEVFKVEPDRVKAIRFAFECSKPGDRIYITGRGSEIYKISEKEYTDDKTVVKTILEEHIKEMNKES